MPAPSSLSSASFSAFLYCSPFLIPVLLWRGRRHLHCAQAQVSLALLMRRASGPV